MSEEVAAVVERGGKVVCFIGKGNLFHLANIIGVYPELHLQEANPADGMVFRHKPFYKLIFDWFLFLAAFLILTISLLTFGKRAFKPPKIFMPISG
jgi:hypothetical protein